jgi:hypothetical protein
LVAGLIPVARPNMLPGNHGIELRQGFKLQAVWRLLT